MSARHARCVSIDLNKSDRGCDIPVASGIKPRDGHIFDGVAGVEHDEEVAYAVAHDRLHGLVSHATDGGRVDSGGNVLRLSSEVPNRATTVDASSSTTRSLLHKHDPIDAVNRIVGKGWCCDNGLDVGVAIVTLDASRVLGVKGPLQTVHFLAKGSGEVARVDAIVSGTRLGLSD